VGFFISCEYLSNMKKFILSESEKKYILNLYRTKNLIKEEETNNESINGPYGLQYDEPTQTVTNFNEVFGFDLSYMNMVVGDDMLGISFNPTTNVIKHLSIFNTNTLPKEKVKELILKVSNNSIRPSDITIKTLPKFDEIFLALIEKKLSNFEVRSSYVVYSKEGVFFYSDLYPTNYSKSKIMQINFESSKTVIPVKLKTGQVLEFNEDFDSKDYVLSADTSGNKILIFNELGSDLLDKKGPWIPPYTTRTADKANLNDLLSDTYMNITYVKMGDKGKIVQNIQHYLLNLGYGKFNITKDKVGCKTDMNKCDGIFGKNTKMAIKKYQKDKDIDIDGIVGPTTGKSLEDSFAKLPK